MRIPARALKYCSLALGVAALAGVALLLAPARGSAHEGGYLDFTGPGSGYLEVPDNLALNPTGAITVEAWIYLNGYHGWGTNPDFNKDPQCPMLVGKNWQSAYALALGCGGDVMDSFIKAIEYFSDTPIIPLHTWTHVAMTYNGATRRNFVNGVETLAVDDIEGPIGVTADPLRIGDDVKWDLSPNGRIDDVRIWNVARTQAEIQAGMNGVTPTAPGLAADWTFDNASLTDATSGLTGALVGDVHLAEDNATPTPSPTPFAGVPSPGDANCDGLVTVPDGSFVLANLGGVQPKPSAMPCNDGNAMIDGQPARDDANCDGAVNVFDVLAIFKHVAALLQLPSSCQTGWTESPSATATPTPTPS